MLCRSLLYSHVTQLHTYIHSFFKSGNLFLEPLRFIFTYFVVPDLSCSMWDSNCLIRDRLNLGPLHWQRLSHCYLWPHKKQDHQVRPHSFF